MSLSIAGGVSRISQAMVLSQLAKVTVANAITIEQNTPPVDIAPGAAVAIAESGTALSRALNYGAAPPDAVTTILQASMFL